MTASALWHPEITLLPYTPPYDWALVHGFLQTRAIAGVEAGDADHYQRTLVVGGVPGCYRIAPVPGEAALALHISPSLHPQRAEVVRRVRRQWDLDADPQAIAAVLGPLAADRPGLRIAGSVHGYEQTVRGILGQLVSVKMAATLTERLAARWGTPLAMPHDRLSVLFPQPAAIARLTVDDLRSIGVQARRSACLIALSRAVADGELDVDAVPDAEQGMRQLLAQPGIGPWTASYIGMRAWAARDVFLTSDYLIKQRFPGMTPGQIARYAARWQPFRSYATLHLWLASDWVPDGSA